MDELELLKKDWKKQDPGYPKLSYNEIYKLIHKNSASVVKWILVICVAEFIFWGLLNLLVPESYLDIYEKFHLKSFINVTQVLHYVVIFIFIYLFYKNHKAISVIDNTNLLMKKIIRTRKTVNYYVYYNIILYVVISVIFYSTMFSKPDVMLEVFNRKDLEVDPSKFLNIMLITQIVIGIIMMGLLWLYYRIIYGILLKKLNKNYKELETLDF